MIRFTLSLTLVGLLAVSSPAQDSVVDELPRLLQSTETLDDMLTSSGGELSFEEEVKQAFMFLYMQHLDLVSRVNKIESVTLKVSTPTGIATRSVAMSNGVGNFQLGPNEVLSGYQDAITGKWVSVGQVQSTKIEYGYQSNPEVILPPVTVYPATMMDIRTMPSRAANGQRGQIRTFFRDCRTCR